MLKFNLELVINSDVDLMQILKLFGISVIKLGVVKKCARCWHAPDLSLLIGQHFGLGPGRGECTVIF